MGGFILFRRYFFVFYKFSKMNLSYQKNKTECCVHWRNATLIKEHSIDKYLLYFKINYIVCKQCSSNGHSVTIHTLITAFTWNYMRYLKVEIKLKLPVKEANLNKQSIDFFFKYLGHAFITRLSRNLIWTVMMIVMLWNMLYFKLFFTQL